MTKSRKAVRAIVHKHNTKTTSILLLTLYILYTHCTLYNYYIQIDRLSIIIKEMYRHINIMQTYMYGNRYNILLNERDNHMHRYIECIKCLHLFKKCTNLNIYTVYQCQHCQIIIKCEIKGCGECNSSEYKHALRSVLCFSRNAFRSHQN